MKRVNCFSRFMFAATVCFAAFVCDCRRTMAQNVSPVIVNPSGGTKASDDLLTVVFPEGKFNIYYKGYKQNYTSDPDAIDGSVKLTDPPFRNPGAAPQFMFKFVKGGTTSKLTGFNPCNISPQSGSGSIGDPYEVVMSGTVESPLPPNRTYNLRVTVSYVKGTKYLMLDFVARSPQGVGAFEGETMHLYLDEDTFVGNDDAGVPFLIGKTNSGDGTFDGGQFTIGTLRTPHNGRDGRNDCNIGNAFTGVDKSRLIADRLTNISYVYKTCNAGSYYSGYTNERMSIGSGSTMLSNSMTDRCDDNGMALHCPMPEFTEERQSRSKRILIGLGTEASDYERIEIADPAISPGKPEPVTVEFADDTSGEAEGDVRRTARSIKIRVGGGKLIVPQSLGIKLMPSAGGVSADVNADFLYQNAFIIPEGNYVDSPREFTIDNITVIGNEKSQPDRAITVGLTAECNDLIKIGKIYSHRYLIYDDDSSLDRPSDQTVCNGAEVSGILFSGSPASGVYAKYLWELAEGENPGLNGTSGETVAGSLPTFSAVNRSNLAKTSKIKITPVRMINDTVPVHCKPVVFSLTVNSAAKIGNKTLNPCSGESFVVVADTGDFMPSGTVYRWKVSGDTGEVLGASDETTGKPSVTGKLTLSGAADKPKRVRYSVTTALNSCTSSFEVEAIVAPKPLIADLEAEACTGAVFRMPVPAGKGDVVPPGTRYSWRLKSTDAGLSIAAVDSSVKESVNLLPTNSSLVPRNAVIEITPSSGACAGEKFELRLTVRAPLAGGAIDSAGEKLCFGVEPRLTIGSAKDASGGDSAVVKYRWTVDGRTIGGASGATHKPRSGDLGNGSSGVYVFSREAVDSTCGTSASSSGAWKVTVLSPSLWNYPDIRAFVCADASAQVNLSKYIDTAEVKSLEWRSANGSATISRDGRVDLSGFSGSEIRSYRYTVSNGCVNGMERNFYLRAIDNDGSKLHFDTVVFCIERLSSIHLNRLFGIEADGKITCTTAGPKIGDYIKHIDAGSYRGSTTFDAAGAFRDPGVLPTMNYHGKPSKYVKFVYEASKQSCLKGKKYETIIVIND